MTEEDKQQLKELLVSEKGAFAYSLSELPGYSGDLGEVDIHMKDDKSIWSGPRRYSPLEQQIGQEKIKEMLDGGIISSIDTLNARHCSAVTMPAKKAPDGTWSDKRFCVDLRKHNDHCIIDKFQVPLPEDLFRKTQDKQWLSKLDCRSGFFNLVLSEHSRTLLNFSFGGKLYAFNRLPFGHVNATAYFQKVMQYEIDQAGLTDKCLVYVDDVLVVSDTFQEHLEILGKLLRRFKEVGLRCHPSKSILAGNSMPYLGHVVSADGMRPEQAKVAAIQALPDPTNADQVRSVLGIIGFYRCYVPAFSSIAQPLNALLRKATVFAWGEDQRVAYTKLKAALTTPGLVLRHPDPHKPFHLYTDWSCHGIAAVLNQREEGGSEYMVACVSRSLNEHERRYEAWKGEALAAVWGVKTFRPYLHGVHFHLHTDHRPLLWLLTAKEPTGQQARWILSLQDYSYSLVHRPGAKNIADLPSRCPQSTVVDATGARLNATADPLHHPLPEVLYPNGAVDSAQYTHDLLLQTKGTSDLAEPHPVTAALLSFAEQGHFMASQLRCQTLDYATASHADDFLDVYAPMPAALLAGHNGGQIDAADAGPDHDQTAAVEQRHSLQQAVQRWVSRARLDNQHVPVREGRCTGSPDAYGVFTTLSLNCRPVPEFFYTPQSVILVEPFGGLCAGLEAALRNGMPIHQYHYLDVDPAARKIAEHRIAHLRSMYPCHLPHSAVQGAFSTPMDIRQLTTRVMVGSGMTNQRHSCLVVAGWPCQDMSMAGKGAGLRGERSSLLHELVRVIGTLQQLRPAEPPAFLIENVPFQYHQDPNIAVRDFEAVCRMLGKPVVLDAAQFGSHAHRVRNWWTNMCSPERLAAAAKQVHRPFQNLTWILEPGSIVPKVKHIDRPPRYICNVPGHDMQALPTLVAFPGSHAFRPGAPGSILRPDGRWDEPTAVERERAMGYPEGSTAAPGVTELQRRRTLGEAMDMFCLEVIFAIADGWSRWEYPKNGIPCQLHYSAACSMLAATAAQDGIFAPTQSQQAPSTDIWHDRSAMHTLQNGTLPEGLSTADRSRVTKRLAYYVWRGDTLLRRMPDGALKQVPRPEERPALIKQLHNQCGHFGIRRTAALVLNSYWWHGLQADVAHLVSGCKECSRIRASFGSAEPADLQPLPIKGLGYRWGVDLAGPFPESTRGNKYVMICVEHFSKHLEAIPIVDKTPGCTSYAFLHNVLARFGACAELVHDNGTEWEGAFAQLLKDALIDPRHTSANHPQANGLAEKCVQTVKRALKKMCLETQSVHDWDLKVPWLLIGYRCSPQKSTGFSPYELLYAQSPVVPPAVVQRMLEPIDLDCPRLAADDLLRRRDLVKQMCPEALHNLQIAQHRDQQRYKHIRSGEYQPRRHRFEVGDFVYSHQTNTANALQPKAKAVILRVIEVRPSGRLILQGKCGSTTDRHMSQCAPCQLPDIDPAVDPSLLQKPQEVVCVACSSALSTTANVILLCDMCDSGWHIKCLPDPLDTVPQGDWMCPSCKQAGVTPAQMSARIESRALRQQLDGQAPQLYPNKAMRKRDDQARSYHGRLMVQNFIDPNLGQKRPFWGRVHYKGALRRPQYFDVHFEDGDIYQYSVAELKPLLQPVGSAPPAGIILPGDDDLAEAPP